MRRRKIKRKKKAQTPQPRPQGPNYAAGLIREMRMKIHKEEMEKQSAGTE